MPEQDQLDDVQLEQLLGTSPEALGQFTSSPDFELILGDLFDHDIAEIFDQFTGPDGEDSYWKKLLRVINTIMQSNWDGQGVLTDLVFPTFADLSALLTNTLEFDPAKFYRLFGHDEAGVQLPRDQWFPLRDSSLSNIFTRREEAGPITSFYDVTMDEWRYSMGVRFHLTFLDEEDSPSSDSAFENDEEIYSD